MSTFQRRHYERVANAIRTARVSTMFSAEAEIGVEKVINHLVGMFGRDNQRFYPEAFRTACRREDYKAAMREEQDHDTL